MSGKNFDPTVSLGQRIISFSYTQQGCTNAISKNIEVFSSPEASITNLDSFYCLDANPLQLEGIPAGGNFSGQGIVNNMLYPSTLSVGTYSATYSVLNRFGCSDSFSKNFEIRYWCSMSFLFLF